MSGPLEGVRIVEFDRVGPAGFAAMVLADLGADVVRVDLVTDVVEDRGASNAQALLNRNKRSVAIDLKHPDGVAVALRLVARADGLVEGFRPGVMERLGVGPQACHGVNPRLTFGRLSGYGQVGPIAGSPGHDINYVAMAGALAHIGRPGAAPSPSPGLVGDLSGGGMVLAFGMLCGVLNARRTGVGQVVDSAVVDGVALLMTGIHGQRLRGAWTDDRGSNVLDGGAHFYDVFETSDHRYVAVGAAETRFYTDLLKRLGLAVPGDGPGGRPMDRREWPQWKERIGAVIRTRSRDEWCQDLEGTDSCVSPVLEPSEVAEHAHVRQRGALVEFEGVLQPAPAPRFERSVARLRHPAPAAGEHSDEVLNEAGFAAAEIGNLRDRGAIA